MSHQNMIRCTTALLLVSIFLERYCFIVTVYKMKMYGYVLILLVISLNCVFNLILSRMTYQKQTKTLHELFSIDRTPTIGSCVIFIIGYVFYALSQLLQNIGYVVRFLFVLASKCVTSILVTSVTSDIYPFKHTSKISIPKLRVTCQTQVCFVHNSCSNRIQFCCFV